MIRAGLAAVLLAIAMLAHPAPAIGLEACPVTAGPFCANVLLDPSQVTDAR